MFSTIVASVVLLEMGTAFTMFLVIIVFLLFLLVISAASTAAVTPRTRWHYPFIDLTMESKDFYTMLEAALHEAKMPDVTISRVQKLEAGLLSQAREYIRITRHHMVFDICAAQFGRPFFISWWQGDAPDIGKSIIRSLPFGKRLEEIFYGKTYYEVDTEDMFQTALHNIVLATIDEIADTKGLRGPTNEERKPVYIRPGK